MTAQTAKESLSAYDLMDAMRALAAMAVLISHARNILFLDAKSELPASWKIFYFATGFGHQAVMIFFVLSGYWITKTVARRSTEGGFAWCDYAIDRLSRLWIVLIPALLIGGIFDAIGRYGIAAPIYFGVQGTNTLTYDVATRLSFINLSGNLAFLQTLVVEPFGSNGPLWSLANEFWYYIWFPSLYQLLQKWRSSIVMSLFALITMGAFSTLLPGFVCWLFGSLLYFATRRPIIRTARPQGGRQVLLVVVSCLFFGVLVLSRVPALTIDGRIQDIAISGTFTLLLFFLIQSAGTYARWLAPLCRYGAGSSYSLYVTHFPLIVLLASLFVTPSHRLPPSGELLLIFTVTVLVAIIYGYGISAVTEANTSKIRHWLKEKYSPLTQSQRHSAKTSSPHVRDRRIN